MSSAPERERRLADILQAVKHTAVYGLGSMAAKVIGFFMLPFYTHYLSPGDYGLLEILDLAMSLLAMVLYMGISPALLRDHAAAKSELARKTVISTAFLFILITAVVTFLAGLAFVRPVSLWLLGPKAPTSFLLLSFASFALIYVASVPRTYLRALEKSGTLTTIETVGVFCMLGLNIYFIAVLKLGPMGIILSSFLIVFLQTIMMAGWLVYRVGIHLDLHRLRGMIRFGLPLILANVAVYTLNFSDRFFLQHLRSLDVVGLYAVGYKVAFMISYILVQPFNIMWQTRMYLIDGDRRRDEIYDQIFVLYSLVLTYAALGLAMVSPEVVRVMAGPKFQDAQEIIPVVSLAYVFCGIGYYMQTGMFLGAKTKILGVFSSVAAVLNLGLNYVLISRFGMMGAAWATLLSFVFIAVGNYIFSQRAFYLSLSVGRVALAIAVAIALYSAARWASPEPVLMALGVKTVLLLSFPCILWALRLLSPAERSTLSSMKDRAFRIVRPDALAARGTVGI